MLTNLKSGIQSCLKTCVYKTWLVALMLSGAATYSANTMAQNVQNKSDDTKEIPIDESVKMGTLDNGMRYYIKKNEMPANRVELRLAINAGSILEEDHQQGLAHFTEHMAFNGTTNFAKNDLIDNLEKMGVRFGADLNAYTSFDETVYMLPLPTDSVGYVDKGLMILKDWASGILMEDEEIDKERGVVIEEWRRRKGAGERMSRQYLPVLMKGSRYAERLPIGKKDILEKFEYQAIRDFYSKWYRPDLMAVVAVGDIDVEEMEKKIKDTFSAIPKTENPAERPAYKVPDNKEVLAKVASDKEATGTQLRLYFKQPKEVSTTLSDLKEDYTGSLATTMLSARFRELTQSAKPPFIYAGGYYGGMYGRDKDAFQVYAGLLDNNIEAGIKTVMEEIERINQHGFTESELERAKTQMLKSYERRAKEVGKTPSNRIVMQYVYHFLDQNPIPSPEFEYNLLKEALPQVSIDEVNKMMQSWITDENRIAILTAIEKEGVELPKEEQIISMWNEAAKAELEPYEEEEIASSLMSKMPTKGSIVSSKENKDYGYTELNLSNGAKVVLKPTEFKNDEILLSAYSYGGHSLYSDEEFIGVSNVASVISQSGIGEFSSTDLSKFMTGKVVRVSPYISELSEGFRGSTAPDDLEDALQMMHLYFTQPKQDKDAISSFVAKQKGFLKNLMVNPDLYFYDEYARLMSGGSIRSGFPKVEELQNVNWDEAFETYNERFADASDFTFFFVGNFKVDEIKPLLETYIASLPSKEGSEMFKDLGERYPEGMVEKNYYRGTEEKANVRLAFAGEMKPKNYTAKNKAALEAVAALLRFKLIEKLREEKGGVYSASAYASASKYPVPSYQVGISFPCAPENVDDLIATAVNEVERLQKGDIDESELDKFKEAEKRKNEVNQTQNRYWLSTLQSMYYNQKEAESIDKGKDAVQNLTVKDVQEVAKKYMDTKAYVKAVLLPEQKDN